MPALAKRAPTSFASDLKKNPPKPVAPLWQGPCDKGPHGGITQSMLQKFLICRERFRVRYVLGLQPKHTFNPKSSYGDMWHVCEEALAKHNGPVSFSNPCPPWTQPLAEFCAGLIQANPMKVEEISHWAATCATQFPVYNDYWAKHPDVCNRTPLMQEQVFDVPYQIPSGRIVRLRGKYDAVDLIEENGVKGVWLQENKTKGKVDEGVMKRQLTFDMQTMYYLVTLHEMQEDMKSLLRPDGERVTPFLLSPVMGVRYNVIRRPFSGGVGTIRRHKPTKSNPQGESFDGFYKRFSQDYLEADPGYWFMRWKVRIGAGDLLKFRNQFLDPILEQLCDWWEFVGKEKDVWASSRNGGTHWRMPFGCYNSLTEGSGQTDLDEYLENGNTVGLERAQELFKELK